MKMQLRILRLRLRMTVPRETMRLIYRAVAMGEFSGQILRIRGSGKSPIHSAQDGKQNDSGRQHTTEDDNATIVATKCRCGIRSRRCRRPWDWIGRMFPGS